MSPSRLALIASTVCLSCVSVDAQERLAETHAPAARMALAQAPLLPLEKVAVAIQVPANWELGRISAVAMGRDGVAFVLQRGDKADPVIVVDRTGRVVRSWGKGMFKIAHSIKVDPDGNVWTTDAGDGRVIKFTSEGKKLQEIALRDAPVGKDCGFPAAAVNNFIDACGTTDITFLPGGRLLLTDGYGRMRVLEYSADGTRIREWGGRGDKPGQFRVPHGLAYDGRSVLYVADRDNGRLQRFDVTGHYLGEWSHLGRVGAIAFSKGVLWAATGIGPVESSQTRGGASSWVIKVDPSTGKILGKTETTNADFIDVGENGEIVAGAVRTSFTWYRPSRPAASQPTIAGIARVSPDAIVPFKIHVPDGVLRDLKARLAKTRFPDEIEGSGWEYGDSLAYMKELVAYWRDKFDWRKQERELNKFDQFTTNIDGLDLHFIHHRSSHPNALPLVITHGYPGSIAEFAKVIGPLTDPERHGGRAEDAFHVIAISMPGYGFSGHPRASGVAHERMAAMIATLMARLGYRRYGVQGGDHGAAIGRLVALNDASHVAGLHLNFCTAPPPAGDSTAGESAADLARMREREAFFENELTGWIAIQQRKPQTLGYALNDSPAGLAAWIVHNFRTLCDCDGDVEKKFTKDELLTNITIYWATESITSAMRLYRELRLANRSVGLNVGAAGSAAAVRGRRVEVPTGCAIFPKEGVFSPRRWVEASHNLVRWTEMPRGGHFPSMEEPGLFVDDVRAFFRGVR